MPAAAQQHHRDRGNNVDICLPQAELRYRPALLSDDLARHFAGELLEPGKLSWRCDDIEMFGRLVKQPRLTVWMADEGVRYRYSGISHSPQPWIAPISELRKMAETAAQCSFNSVLINQYRNGHDHVGWHRDNEPELGVEPVIATLSLGATRFFDLRHRDYRNNKLAVQRFELQSGDLIVMRGLTQQHWQHRVPRQTRITEPRLNLSFRRVIQTSMPKAR